MNIGNSIVSIVASLMLMCGCDKGGADVPRVEELVAAGEVAGGGKITIEKKTAERSCVFKIGGKDRTVSFTASMEYPMHFGIPKEEYRNLTGLVDEMFNKGTNFETSVENVFSNLVTSAREASTDEAAEAEQSYSLEARGQRQMVFADERYFSYMLEEFGGEGDDLRTYDRKLGRTITLTDLVATNDFGVISKQVRGYVKLGLGPLFNVQDENHLIGRLRKHS